MTPEIIFTPNMNDDGYPDNWTCEHIEAQIGNAPGETWMCEECCDL